VQTVQPQKILELGCGQGKFGELIGGQAYNYPLLKAVQKLFTTEDRKKLEAIGYSDVIDVDIMEYFRQGFDETYNIIVALDVIEHFLYSDLLSIINFSLYRADYMLIVWPSAHPQSATSHQFDRHRASFELRDLSERFDVVYYTQTGFAALNSLHRYHLALLRGHMNINVLPPLI